MLNCFQVANYLLSLSNEEEGDLISNLKLQKLMYYAQGLHLAVYDRPLFPERIEAWQHGPVVPDLYHELKQFGKGAIPKPVIDDFSVYSEETVDILTETYNVYGQFSAWRLAEMTHEERPWIESFLTKSEITHEQLRTFFKPQVKIYSEN